MKDSRYPKDWKAIALLKKQSVNWTCQNCGRYCYTKEVADALGLDRSDRKRYELSVHHSDYNPENNSPENLIALCSGCHLGKHSRKRGNVTPGDLSENLQPSHSKPSPHFLEIPKSI